MANLFGAISGLIPQATSSGPRIRTNDDLLTSFRTTTLMISLLQPITTSGRSGSSVTVETPMKLTRNDALLLRNLTALAIAIARRKEVTAVVATRPQFKLESGEVRLIAASQSGKETEETEETETTLAPMLRLWPFRHFFALRNPHFTHPKLDDSDAKYQLLAAKLDPDLDLSQQLPIRHLL
jgi:hypothetical protein